MHRRDEKYVAHTSYSVQQIIKFKDQSKRQREKDRGGRGHIGRRKTKG